jgi:uncharacterized protein involved in type VI secretion and phage assembly
MRFAETQEESVDPLGGGMPLSGVAVAIVIKNIDPTNQGRIQLRLPWLPDVEPWARVASLSGGNGRGIYFIPQVDDEVLVAFHHGDVREPYVIGSLWSTQHPTPTNSPQDSVNRRVIRTPKGHEIELDDLKQSITVKTMSGMTIRMEPEHIEVSTTGGTAKIFMETSGKVSISASTEIELKAPKVTLDAVSLELKGSASAKLSGSGVCEVQGGMVKIN